MGSVDSVDRSIIMSTYEIQSSLRTVVGDASPREDHLLATAPACHCWSARGQASVRDALHGWLAARGIHAPTRSRTSPTHGAVALWVKASQARVVPYLCLNPQPEPFTLMPRRPRHHPHMIQSSRDAHHEPRYEYEKRRQPQIIIPQPYLNIAVRGGRDWRL